MQILKKYSLQSNYLSFLALSPQKEKKCSRTPWFTSFRIRFLATARFWSDDNVREMATEVEIQKN